MYDHEDVKVVLRKNTNPFILVRTDLHLGWTYCSDACCFR